MRVVNGVFQAHYHQTSKKIYTLTNQTDKPFIEHPVRQDWTLTDDAPKPDGKSRVTIVFAFHSSRTKRLKSQ